MARTNSGKLECNRNCKNRWNPSGVLSTKSLQRPSFVSKLDMTLKSRYGNDRVSSKTERPGKPVGAYDVLAVDASVEMLEHARKLYCGNKIRWIELTFESLDLAPGSVQLVVACLSFHFVEKLEDLLKRCAVWLCGGGLLVFSVRHPIRTCNPAGEINSGGEISWTVKDYFLEGPREFSWLGVPCVNFHRPISSYIRMLHEAGLILEKVMEPSDAIGTSELALEGKSVPFFLTLSCRKTQASI